MRDNRKEQVHILPVPGPNSNAIRPDPEFITPLLLFLLHSAWARRAISDHCSTFKADEGTTEQIIPGGSGRICQASGVELKDYRQIRRHWAGMEQV